MNLFKNLRSKGNTYEGQGDERKGFIDNVFINLEKGCLVHRHPYDNLSTHAKVTVQEGQQMVFMSEGMYSDLLKPGGHTLSTNNIPFLEKIVNIPFGGETAFKTSLYVVSTIRHRFAGDDAGWGVGLTIRDYSLCDEGLTIKVGAFGSYEFRITNAIAFIREYVGTEHDVYLEDFADEFSSAVSQRVTSVINQYFSQKRVGVTEVNNYLLDISDYARKHINEYFEEYGLELTKFDVEGINPHEDDSNYQQILQAQSEAGSMDLESRALARKRQREGYSCQQERQLDVMETAAGNEGTAGNIMGASMGLGMGVGIGNVFGSQIGTVAHSAMSGVQAPPPPPQSMQIYVCLNQQQAGPYDLPILQQLVSQNLLTQQTLVWKAGLPSWVAAATLPELAVLFTSATQAPPPIPPVPPVVHP